MKNEELDFHENKNFCMVQSTTSKNEGKGEKKTTANSYHRYYSW